MAWKQQQQKQQQQSGKHREGAHPKLLGLEAALPRLPSSLLAPAAQGIGLAIQALHALLQGGAGAPGRRACRLVVAGGYDPRLAENVEHLRELQALASDLGLREKVRPASGPQQ